MKETRTVARLFTHVRLAAVQKTAALSRAFACRLRRGKYLPVLFVEHLERANSSAVVLLGGVSIILIVIVPARVRVRR